MKEYILEGEIGWDIGSWSVNRILNDANGEDIKINFSSPGGGVFTGFKIFNAFKNYSGKVWFNITGIAASMGAYIPMAADKITGEANSVFMIHNVWTVIAGDQNEMRKEAEILEGLSDIIAKQFVQKTGKSFEEVKQLMDDESWFFGDQIVEHGFMDSIDGGSEIDKMNSIIKQGKEAFKNCIKNKKEESFDYQLVASLTEDMKNFVSNVNETASSGKKGDVMDISKLKAEHPSIYEAVLSEGMKAGVEMERQRCQAHLTMGEAMGAIDIAIEAINNGDEMNQLFVAKYNAALVNKTNIENRDEDETKLQTSLDNVDYDDKETTQSDKVFAKVKKLTGYKEVA